MICQLNYEQFVSCHIKVWALFVIHVGEDVEFEK